MKVVLFTLLLISTSCATSGSKKPTETLDACPMNYDPHLCHLIIDEEMFTAYGENKCVALKNLRELLVSKNHNPELLKIVKCGPVYQ
ncbi:hypothetical protein EBR43_05125 [bacterium]|nr:hypothetical protein [bacterium]